ncbi:hypothetical protein [Aminobacter aminovorans]|uniref:hypothetical protein n=1 Tax=Aminobacter aminovorans TaxID=83263 RepID=UPI00140526B0|nr:hypothetical protein [Aminobacter aminovorans]
MIGAWQKSLPPDKPIARKLDDIGEQRLHRAMMRSASRATRSRSASAARLALSCLILRIIVARSGKRAEDAFELFEFITTQFRQVDCWDRAAARVC